MPRNPPFVHQVPTSDADTLVTSNCSTPVPSPLFSNQGRPTRFCLFLDETIATIDYACGPTWPSHLYNLLSMPFQPCSSHPLRNPLLKLTLVPVFLALTNVLGCMTSPSFLHTTLVLCASSLPQLVLTLCHKVSAFFTFPPTTPPATLQFAPFILQLCAHSR